MPCVTGRSICPEKAAEWRMSGARILCSRVSQKQNVGQIFSQQECASAGYQRLALLNVKGKSTKRVTPSTTQKTGSNMQNTFQRNGSVCVYQHTLLMGLDTSGIYWPAVHQPRTNAPTLLGVYSDLHEGGRVLPQNLHARMAGYSRSLYDANQRIFKQNESISSFQLAELPTEFALEMSEDPRVENGEHESVAFDFLLFLAGFASDCHAVIARRCLMPHSVWPDDLYQRRRQNASQLLSSPVLFCVLFDWRV